MFHDQRRTNSIDLENMRQITGVQMGQAALGLPLHTMQKSRGNHQQPQFKLIFGAFGGHPARCGLKAGFVAVINRRLAAVAQRQHLWIRPVCI